MLICPFVLLLSFKMSELCDGLGYNDILFVVLLIESVSVTAMASGVTLAESVRRAALLFFFVAAAFTVTSTVAVAVTLRLSTILN